MKAPQKYGICTVFRAPLLNSPGKIYQIRPYSSAFLLLFSKGLYVLLGTPRDGYLGEGPDPTPLPQFRPEGVRIPT